MRLIGACSSSSHVLSTSRGDPGSRRGQGWLGKMINGVRGGTGACDGVLNRGWERAWVGRVLQPGHAHSLSHRRCLAPHLWSWGARSGAAPQSGFRLPAQRPE